MRHVHASAITAHTARLPSPPQCDDAGLCASGFARARWHACGWGPPGSYGKRHTLSRWPAYKRFGLQWFLLGETQQLKKWVPASNRKGSIGSIRATRSTPEVVREGSRGAHVTLDTPAVAALVVQPGSSRPAISNRPKPTDNIMRMLERDKPPGPGP